jgi:hypothetical protein
MDGLPNELRNFARLNSHSKNKKGELRGKCYHLLKV